MPFSVYKSVGEVLKFTIAAAHKVDFGPSTNGDGHMVVMQCFLRDLLEKNVEQDG